jgi:hypothetical protein
MKGIYLTQEGKAEIQAKIADLEKQCLLILRAANSDKEFEMMQNVAYAKNKAIIYSLSEILSSATILSIEESWSDMQILNNDNLEYVKSKFANGVIIQPKQ